MNNKRFINKLEKIDTPFYFYDMDLLRKTLKSVTEEAGKFGYKVHYALKANFSERILAEVKKFNIGADCVSGGEVKRALDCEIPASEIVFAGVAKSDAEIRIGLQNDIFSFNCESREEIEVINVIAGEMGKKARIALRINPDVDPMTHKYISTGKAENKFGISYDEIDGVINELQSLKNIELIGIHFHIGSQIRDLSVFKKLSERVNAIQEWFDKQGIKISNVNVGGGLGIDYDDPEGEPMPDFKSYFEVFHNNLKLRDGQTLHFELGRSIVAQCGSLITKVLYNKINGQGMKIVLVDAGMTDLIRPALYQAKHRIENLSAEPNKNEHYMVAGPICESSDVFAKDVELPVTKRGDLLELMSAGAYGRCMASNYNLRKFPDEVFSDEL